MAGTRYLPNPHPGDVLREDFLGPMGLSQSALARAVGVSPRRINEVVLGKRAVTAETDLLLARYFGISEGIFLGLQADYDLEAARRTLGNKLKIVQPHVAPGGVGASFRSSGVPAGRA